MAILAEKLLAQNFFSLDTETTGIDPITAELVGMSYHRNRSHHGRTGGNELQFCRKPGFLCTGTGQS